MSEKPPSAPTSTIPLPNFQSYLHPRQEVKKENFDAILKRYRTQPTLVQAVDAVMSRLFALGLKINPNHPILMYKVITRTLRVYLRIVNRLRIFGIKNIPKEGAIFYVNHPGQFDPAILLASFPLQTGALVAWGNGWFMDMLEHYYGILSLRREGMANVVERIVRHFLTRNRYFAIWPEGHPTYQRKLEDGHSSIIRAYGVLNYDKDRVPFVPVLLRGAQCYRIIEQYWPAENPQLKRTNPIEVHFFPPIFFPRDWLLTPEQGGKTPREMTDFLMKTLGGYQKQRKLLPNRLLEMRRKGHANKKPIF